MAKNDTPEIPGLFDDLPEEAPQEQIAKISLRSWRTHLASIRTLDKRIEKMIDEAVKQALAQGRKLTSADIGRVSQRHPELRAALDKTMQQLNDDLTATIEQGSKDAWLRANTAADAVVAAMANNNAQLAALLNAGTNKPQNDRALRAFQQREMQGLKLSDRVWRATEGMKLDMERAIEVALAEGVPAQKLSERVRELLKEPHRLYRRVRDKDGNLRLSQAAQKYHPGTGVYRSSYKNAMRVARTEVNMAYQASDSERWTRSWWVKGIRVSLSNNHTSPDSKGRPAALVDICDELAGDYPADFKFTGWHPQCRCFATAITCEYSDIRDYYRRKRAGEDMTGYTPPGTITEPPEQFKRWMADNSDRLAGAAQRGTTPYFIANNAKYTDPNWKPSKATASADPMPAPRPKTPLEIADERHARRTAEEAADIQKRWSERRLHNLQTAFDDGLLPEAAKSKLKVLKRFIDDGKWADFNMQVKPLQTSAYRHVKRDPIEIAKIKTAWEQRKAKYDGNTTPQLKHVHNRCTKEQAMVHIKNMTGCSDTDADRFYTAVRRFSEDWDYDIRQVQMGNTTLKCKHGRDINDVIAAAEDIEEFIRVSPKWAGGSTYRGMSLSPLELADTLDKLNAGTFHNFGCASWSTDKKVSMKFSARHIDEDSPAFGDKKTEAVVLVLKEQKRATSIRHISRVFGEHEVLASKECRYRFVSQKKARGITYIEVEAI